jgi:hypothetical protein
MNRHIVTAIRCFLILLLPAVSYAISTQWAARGGKANKNEINAKPSQHAVAHSKGTASPAMHGKGTASPAMHGKRTASPAMHGKRSAAGAGSAHVQHMQTRQHMGPWGRHSAEVSPTPTPTPETTATTPAPDLTETPTPSPAG